MAGLGAAAVLEGRDALHRDTQKPPEAGQGQIQGEDDALRGCLEQVVKE